MSAQLSQLIRVFCITYCLIIGADAFGQTESNPSPPTDQEPTDSQKAAMQEKYSGTDWQTGGFHACLLGADCEPLVACPMNRVCYNNCNVGYDPGRKGKGFGAFLASIFGVKVDVDYHVTCLADCIQRKEKDCQEPQPLDLKDATQTPLSLDPYNTCMQYCGGDRNAMCRRTCDNLRNISQCFQKHATDKAIDECGDSSYHNLMTSSDMYWDDDYVHKVIKAFVWDARCTIKPETAGCESMCEEAPGYSSRICRDKVQMNEAALAALRARTIEDAEAASKASGESVATTQETSQSIDSQEERIKKRLAAQKEKGK